MPRIEEIIDTKKYKFKKSSYRPWNYMDEISKEEKQKKEINQKSIGNQLVINEKKKDLKILGSVKEKSKTTIDTSLDNIFRLSGHQQTIFFFIIEKCLSRGQLNTGAITQSILMLLTKTTSKMVKTSIQRLLLKGLVNREKGKTGRGGFYIFSIGQHIREAALTYKKMVPEYNEKEIKEESISNQSEIGYEFSEKIDIEPLKTIGFYTHHLKQITSQNKLSPEVIQQSIHAFAFDLTENNKAKNIKSGDPLSFFMGILRKGLPYLPPPNYESPEDKAMRIFLERKKETEKRRQEMEEEAIKLACSEWVGSLSQEEKEALLSEDAKRSHLQAFRTAELRTYFRENLWPKKKAEFLSDLN